MLKDLLKRAIDLVKMVPESDGATGSKVGIGVRRPCRKLPPISKIGFPK